MGTRVPNHPRRLRRVMFIQPHLEVQTNIRCEETPHDLGSHAAGGDLLVGSHWWQQIVPRRSSAPEHSSQSVRPPNPRNQTFQNSHCSYVRGRNVKFQPCKTCPTSISVAKEKGRRGPGTNVCLHTGPLATAVRSSSNAQ